MNRIRRAFLGSLARIAAAVVTAGGGAFSGCVPSSTPSPDNQPTMYGPAPVM